MRLEPRPRAVLYLPNLDQQWQVNLGDSIPNLGPDCVYIMLGFDAFSSTASKNQRGEDGHMELSHESAWLPSMIQLVMADVVSKGLAYISSFVSGLWFNYAIGKQESGYLKQFRRVRQSNPEKWKPASLYFLILKLTRSRSLNDYASQTDRYCRLARMFPIERLIGEFVENR